MSCRKLQLSFRRSKGGCCRICGSVEHFKKDCPKHQEKGGVFLYDIHFYNFKLLFLVLIVCDQLFQPRKFSSNGYHQMFLQMLRNSTKSCRKLRKRKAMLSNSKFNKIFGSYLGINVVRSFLLAPWTKVCSESHIVNSEQWETDRGGIITSGPLYPHRSLGFERMTACYRLPDQKQKLQ